MDVIRGLSSSACPRKDVIQAISRLMLTILKTRSDSTLLPLLGLFALALSELTSFMLDTDWIHALDTEVCWDAYQRIVEELTSARLREKTHTYLIQVLGMYASHKMWSKRNVPTMVRQYSLDCVDVMLSIMKDYEKDHLNASLATSAKAVLKMIVDRRSQ
jgi:hypothetical protein